MFLGQKRTTAGIRILTSNGYTDMQANLQQGTAYCVWRRRKQETRTIKGKYPSGHSTSKFGHRKHCSTVFTEVCGAVGCCSGTQTAHLPNDYGSPWEAYSKQDHCVWTIYPTKERATTSQNLRFGISRFQFV